MNKKRMLMLGGAGVALALAVLPIFSAMTSPTSHPPQSKMSLEEAQLYGEAPAAVPVSHPTPPQEITHTPPPTVTHPVQFDKNASTPKPMVPRLTLSPKAQQVLTALENTYVNQVENDALKAQITRQRSQSELMQLTRPAKPVVEKTKPKPTTPLIDRLTVNSIVVTDAVQTAWVTLDTQLIPISQGAHIDSLKVVSINKNAIVFEDASGQRLTKYANLNTSKSASNKDANHDKAQL